MAENDTAQSGIAFDGGLDPDFIYPPIQQPEGTPSASN